jgi:hypothetical protein
MGLSGVTLDLTLRLRRIETAYILAKNIVTRDLNDTFRQTEATEHSTYSVAWLDGVARGSRLGRGVVMLGEHAELADLPPVCRCSPNYAAKAIYRSVNHRRMIVYVPGFWRCVCLVLRIIPERLFIHLPMP